MSNVDYYDVQAMIRDARSEIRGELQEAIHEAKGQLAGELDDLAREISALRNVLDARVADLEDRLNVRV